MREGAGKLRGGRGAARQAAVGSLRARATLLWAKLRAAWRSLRWRFAVALRAGYLGALLGPMVATSPVLYLDAGALPRRLWMLAFVEALKRCGPAFVKWGQWASTRPDMFPPDMCSVLEVLQASAPSHRFRHTQREVEQAFGRPLGEIFAEFEEKPLASGSIAQVHRAKLQPVLPADLAEAGDVCAGGSVAVKVRHPGVENALKTDFSIMLWVAQQAARFDSLEWLRLDESVRQFHTQLFQQLDLEREAAYLRKFNTNFRNWNAVHFPVPVFPLVSEGVLVESFEEGSSILEYMRDPPADVSKPIANLGLRTLLKMMLVDNLIHADLHPGNVLVRLHNQKKKRKPEIVLLDVGMTASLSNHDTAKVLDFFVGVSRRDGDRVVDAILGFNRKTPQTCRDVESFRVDIVEQFKIFKKLYPPYQSHVQSTGIDDSGYTWGMQECMQGLLEIVRKHRVSIEAEVCTLMVTMMVLEGWQRTLDPDLAVLDTLDSVLLGAKMMQKLPPFRSAIDAAWAWAASAA